MRDRRTATNMKHTIKWTIHPYRKDKRTGWVSSVKQSEYYKYLLKNH